MDLCEIKSIQFHSCPRYLSVLKGFFIFYIRFLCAFLNRDEFKTGGKMVHSVTNTQSWPPSRQQGNHGNRQQMANHVLWDQESLINASRGAQCRPFDNMPARDVGIALRLLADSWLYERKVGFQMRTIADEVYARHQRRRNNVLT